jgi:hypothetical protein
VGEIFPINSLTCTNGRVFKLVGGNPGLVHVFFGRSSGCAICNFHYKQYSTKIDDFEKMGLLSVIVIHSAKDIIEENQGSLKWATRLNFVADPEMDTFRTVGAEKKYTGLFSVRAMREARQFIKEHGVFKRLGSEKTEFQMPVEFMIDASNGKVLAVKKAKSAADRWSLLEIETIAKANAQVREAEKNSEFLLINN